MDRACPLPALRAGGASGYDPVPGELPANSPAGTKPWRYGHWTGGHIDPKTRLHR